MDNYNLLVRCAEVRVSCVDVLGYRGQVGQRHWSKAYNPALQDDRTELLALLYEHEEDWQDMEFARMSEKFPNAEVYGFRVFKQGIGKLVAEFDLESAKGCI